MHYISNVAAYYNEFDPFAAEWLRHLIKAGVIAPGDVDDRSIKDVQAEDLKGYNQCHFFAGIGGWSRALRLADWDDTRPVWTGSCPCQPFSTAGKKARQSDERHLWPYWSRLVRESRPPALFGEQVATAVAAGWWDDVANDLEAEGYACAAAVLPACSVGKGHKRDRLWFVGNSHDARPYGKQERRRNDASVQHFPQRQDSTCQLTGAGQPRHVSSGLMADAGGGRCGGESQGEIQQQGGAETFSAGGHEWLNCGDGKSRVIKPGIRLLAYGVHNRVGKLCGYGNAIVPELAAEFIMASSLS